MCPSGDPRTFARLNAPRTDGWRSYPITDGTKLETKRNNTVLIAGLGTLTITPSTMSASGRWFQLAPPSTGGIWIELRRSSDLTETECRDGIICSRDVCGFSNHEAAAES
jgi:hypothetical protein